MSSGEFDLIARHFFRSAQGQPLGVGDDCALLQGTPGQQWAVSKDLLIEGRHFFPDVDPEALGHKALAVNLSDLAAMGAKPVACFLGLGLPRVEDAWLAAFSRGFRALADATGCELLGGDTTWAPTVTLSVTVMGEVPPGQALRRGGIQGGDELWVSGVLGDARLALLGLQGQAPPGLTPAGLSQVRRALEWPQPRLALGQALRGCVRAAMDLSDGLAGDLRHLVGDSPWAASTPSRWGACVEETALPRSAVMRGLSPDVQLHCVMAGGDDYELLWAAAPDQAEAIRAAGQRVGVPVHRIGHVVDQAGVWLRRAQGPLVAWTRPGWDHFQKEA